MRVFLKKDWASIECDPLLTLSEPEVTQTGFEPGFSLETVIGHPIADALNRVWRSIFYDHPNFLQFCLGSDRHFRDIRIHLCCCHLTRLSQSFSLPSRVTFGTR